MTSKLRTTHVISKLTPRTGRAHLQALVRAQNYHRRELRHPTGPYFGVSLGQNSRLRLDSCHGRLHLDYRKIIDPGQGDFKGSVRTPAWSTSPSPSSCPIITINALRRSYTICYLAIRSPPLTFATDFSGPHLITTQAGLSEIEGDGNQWRKSRGCGWHLE